MKQTYILGIDAAKHKIRAALRGAEEERFLYEKDLPARAAGVRELLNTLQERVPEKERLLVVLEATGVLHLNWSAALAKAGYKAWLDLRVATIYVVIRGIKKSQKHDDT
jgi:transposase